MWRFTNARTTGALATAVALVLTPVAATADSAQQEDRGGVEAGVLTCRSIEGTKLNLLVHSEVDVSCVFETVEGKIEHYTGSTGIGAGLDLSWDEEQTISFSVVSGGTDISAGQYSLAGTYAGGKASIAAGLGVGAAALIGGSDDNIALQPLGLETRKGVGIAAGLTYLDIAPDRAADDM